MSKDEADFKKIISQLSIDTRPNPKHRETLRRQMLSVFNKTSQKSGTAITDIWRIIMTNRITKLAVAAVIAIILLVPLSYGTSLLDLLKSMIIKETLHLAGIYVLSWRWVPKNSKTLFRLVILDFSPRMMNLEGL